MFSKFLGLLSWISLVAAIGTVTTPPMCSAERVVYIDGRDNSRMSNSYLNESGRLGKSRENYVIVVQENRQKESSLLEKVGKLLGGLVGR